MTKHNIQLYYRNGDETFMMIEGNHDEDILTGLYVITKYIGWIYRKIYKIKGTGHNMACTKQTGTYKQSGVYKLTCTCNHVDKQDVNSRQYTRNTHDYVELTYAPLNYANQITTTPAIPQT